MADSNGHNDHNDHSNTPNPEREIKIESAVDNSDIDPYSYRQRPAAAIEHLDDHKDRLPFNGDDDQRLPFPGDRDVSKRVWFLASVVVVLCSFCDGLPRFPFPAALSSQCNRHMNQKKHSSARRGSMGVLRWRGKERKRKRDGGCGGRRQRGPQRNMQRKKERRDCLLYSINATVIELSVSTMRW